MGNSSCCAEKNLDIIEYDTQIAESNPEKIIDFYLGIMEKINKKILLRKEKNIDKSYLTNLSNIPELIEIINKNIELIENKHEKDGGDMIKKNLNLKIDNILTEIEQQIETTSNKIKILSELELKEKEEINNFLQICEPDKKEAINYINNIDEKDLENFVNKKIPTKKEFLILKLIFLIINPEDVAKIPGIIFIKDLEIMHSECFKKGPVEIKKQLKNFNDKLSIITSDILEENKIFVEYPYNNLNEMEKISLFHKNFFGFFQNFIKCKKSYDNYLPILKKYEETKKEKESCIKKKARLEKIKQEIILLNKR